MQKEQCRILCKKRGMLTAYEGETARYVRSRGEEHIKALKRKDENSVLNKHLKNEHSEEENDVKFEMNLTGVFKTPLERQINEGNRIKNKQNNLLLNSKQEFHKPSVDRNKERSIPDFKCNNCDFKVKNTKDLNVHIFKEHTELIVEVAKDKNQKILMNSRNQSSII